MFKTSNAPFIRYHFEIGFPKEIGEMALEFFSNFDKIITTAHSAVQLADDSRGVIPFPTKEQLMAPGNILVEIYEKVDKYGVPARIIQKALIRCRHFDERRDYSYVVSREGCIISAWSNDKNDYHRLLNRDVYFSNFYQEEIEMPEVLRENNESEE